MIQANDLNLVIVTPPKTASESLHQTICPPYIWVNGPCPWNFVEIDKHSQYLPWKAKEHHYKVALVVRHPLSRVLSFWNHHVHYYNEHIDFQTFLYSRINPKEAWYWPCTRYYDQYNYFVRFEHLIPDLKKIGIKIDKLTCEINRWPHKWEPEDLLPKDREHILKLYKEDLKFYES